MKKLIGLLLVCTAFSMCQNNQKAIEESYLKNDSLQQLVNQKDSSLYTFINTLSLIEYNLQSIKDKEGIINTTALDDTEHFKSREEKINEDIETIYGLMVENKEAIGNLENELKESKMNEKNLRSIIATLNHKLLVKDAEILELRKKLKQMDIQLVKLNYKIDTLSLQNKMNQDLVELQGQTLKTAFYVIGNSKELKEIGIIKTTGIFGKIEINDDFDKSHFSQLDILNDTLFKVNSKKIDILSVHPNASYILSKEDVSNELTIIEPWDFWSVSKYMVIIVK